MKDLHITVRDMAGVERLRPVTGGVPITEGAAPEGSVFVLRDAQGNDVPVQTRVLARWKDGSARWVLLDFQSAPPVSGEAEYVLSWADEAAPPKDEPVEYDEADDVTLTVRDGALLDISERIDVAFVLTDEQGEVCHADVELGEPETTGACRSTLMLTGAFRTPAGERVFQFRLRASAFAGLSLVRLEPQILVDADSGILQRIRELKLVLTTRATAQAVRLGGDPGWEGSDGSGVRLFQYDDQSYNIESAEGAGGRAPGWAELDDDHGTVAVALRSFWQQWPKSIETADSGLAIGLFPSFRDGDYAHMEPWYKHQYLFHGDCYQLRTGQARRWDIWIDLAGNGEELAAMADAPLIPAADPAQAIATGVWDSIEPAGTDEMADYDAWAENLFDAYCRSIEVQRDYGAMNWGDWFGERRVNWGNHEYDTTNQILIQFARTGDPRYLHTADAAARHSAEVDTIHHVNDDLAKYFTENFGCPKYPPRPGMVHEHAVGHVGGFHSVETVRELLVEHGVGHGSKTPYLCLDPYNLGHIWTQGMVRQYFLTGDPFLRETVEKIGANLAQLSEDGEYKFIGHSHCGRTAGWSMLAMAGAYELDFDERHLNAMKRIVEAAIDEQDPNCGGWLYELPTGHCFCEKRKHTGMAGFITSILINGLSRYYFLSGDERLREVIDRAVTFLDLDTWHEEWSDWRYTSCPATRAVHQPGVTIMAHVNGARITDNPDHLRVLQRAWQAKFERLRQAPSPGPGQGKTFSSTLYGCAEAVGLLKARGELSGGE